MATNSNSNSNSNSKNETQQAEAEAEAEAVVDDDDENQSTNSHSKDLVIRDGFPALLDKSTNKWWIDETDETMIFPRWPFWSHDEAILFSNNHNDNNNNNSMLPSLLRDCHTVFTARTRDDDAAYSAGTTYFLPAHMAPRCALEGLVQFIFQQHTQQLKLEGCFRPEQSGAEWWTLVLGDDTDTDTAKEPINVDKKLNDDNQNANADKNHKEDEDEEEEDEVGWHYDADYGLEDQAPGLLLHPRVGTITYLTDHGAPTVVLDCKTPHQGKVQNLHRQKIKTAWISYPRVGKHAVFDGRLLHGAPARVFPSVKVLQQQLLLIMPNTTANATANHQTTLDHHQDDDSKPPPSKRTKLDDSNYSEPHGNTQQQQQQAAYGQNQSQSQGEQQERVTLLVNIWLNHCPLDAELLDDDIVEQLTTPWQTPPPKQCDSDKGNNNSDNNNNNSLFTWNPAADMTQEPPPLKQDTLVVTDANDNRKNDDDDNDDNNDEELLEDEVVIGNHRVKVQYGAPLHDYHRVVAQHWVANNNESTSTNGNSHKDTSKRSSSSLALDLTTKGIITLQVGDPVSSDSEAETEEAEEKEPQNE